MRQAFVALFVFMAVAVTPFRTLSLVQHHEHRDSISFVSEAYAQESAPTPEPSVSPAPAEQPSSASKVAAFLGMLADKIPTEGVIIAVLAFVYDFVRRKWPTKNPASLVRDVQAVLKAIVKFIQKIDALLDSVLGQNLKQ